MGRAMTQRNGAMRLAVGMLVLAQMACRPAVTVGWWEIAIVVVLLAIVVLPLLLRLLRWLDSWRGSGKGTRKGR